MIEAWARYVPPRLAEKGAAASAPLSAAAWDEDSFTMAVEAGARCLRARAATGASGPIDSAFVVRSAEPGEGGDRALLEALGLDPATRLIALPGSVDGAADALDLALGAAEAGGSALLLAASAPAGAGGDGAAALVLGPGGGSAGVARALVNLARIWSEATSAAVVPRRYDAREVVAPALAEAFERALAETGWAAADVDAWACAGAPARSADGLGLGMEPLEGNAPYQGADGADLLLSLVALCARGGRVASIGVGERAAVFLWEVESSGAASLDPLPAGEPLGFAEYTLEMERRGAQARQQVDPMDYVREAGRVLRLEGTRCGSCGAVTAASRATAGRASPERHCAECGGEAEPVALAREGTVRAFTRSQMEAQPSGYAVCDLDGGGRMLVELAGGGPQDAEVGDRVELVLRRGPSEGGANFYLWKAVPRG